ncbi:hypothetical protein NHP21005_10070 [Helicobacter sp. NHP21005]|uniref:hypothetical protein n=1 Tax=Helicobacter felistomachi TaxID=3040201 RepID=UPI002572F7D7|nr:hypothetical protein [Helicobacter sp. NHP21005]BEG57319.1 hypothetical protein NHP21005_10070 [Helicobacter sp. NHP21005]
MVSLVPDKDCLGVFTIQNDFSVKTYPNIDRSAPSKSFQRGVLGLARVLGNHNVSLDSNAERQEIDGAIDRVMVTPNRCVYLQVPFLSLNL